MKIKSCFDNETVEMLQNVCQKIRESANTQIKDDEAREDFFLCLAAQFFIYSLIGNNNRFVAIKQDYYEKKKDKFLEMLDVSVIGKYENEN